MDPTIGNLGMGGLGGLEGLGASKSKGVSEGAPGDGIAPFKDLLESSLRRVNEMQEAASQAKIDIATGGTENMGEAMASIKKAELAFQQLMEIRNKLVDAYQEVMRMQV